MAELIARIPFSNHQIFKLASHSFFLSSVNPTPVFHFQIIKFSN